MNVLTKHLQTARHLPKMDPNVRLAAALAFARLMFFILSPDAENLDSLPPVLRPSKVQQQIPHSFGVDFVLHPALRDALVLNPQEWLSSLDKFGLRLNDCGSWGDTGGISLTEYGEWGAHEELMDEIWGPGTMRDQKESGDSHPRAILRDKITGERFITPEFEKHAFDISKWSASREILELMPELVDKLKFHD